jgi:hypothetical protein
MLMALYALGQVSRYNPALWHPFVRTDATGERLLIERFLTLATRWLPNLVLSAVTKKWTRFTTVAVQPVRGLAMLTKDDLRQMVEGIVSDIPARE